MGEMKGRKMKFGIKFSLPFEEDTGTYIVVWFRGPLQNHMILGISLPVLGALMYLDSS